jgi:hypothetical protein
MFSYIGMKGQERQPANNRECKQDDTNELVVRRSYCIRHQKKTREYFVGTPLPTVEMMT